MESQKYRFGGVRDVESTDGGTNACVYGGTPFVICDQANADKIYEIGNKSGLNL